MIRETAELRDKEIVLIRETAELRDKENKNTIEELRKEVGKVRAAATDMNKGIKAKAVKYQEEQKGHDEKVYELQEKFKSVENAVNL